MQSKLKIGYNFAFPELFLKFPGRCEITTLFSYGNLSACLRKSETCVLLFTVLSIILSGGLFAGVPDNIEKSWILTDEDLKYFVETYSKTGFR